MAEWSYLETIRVASQRKPTVANVGAANEQTATSAKPAPPKESFFSLGKLFLLALLGAAGYGAYKLRQQGLAAEQAERDELLPPALTVGDPYRSSPALPPSHSFWPDPEPRHEYPPAFVADPEIWEAAKAEALPEWHRFEEPWAYVARLYDQMGGRRLSVPDTIEGRRLR